MSHAEEVIDLIKKNNRYELIIREKDKIIAALRDQLRRQEETHRELMRMLGSGEDVAL